MEQQGYKVVRGDRQGSIPEPIDYIFDLATYGNLHYHKDKKQIWYANYYRVIDLVLNSHQDKPKAIIFTSTSSVTLPIQTEYSKSKREMELFVTQEHDDKVLDNYVIVRPYTVYGVGDTEHLIPIVFDSCINGTEMDLDPTPTHDYIWVGDLVDNYIKIAQDIKYHNGRTIEMGSGIATTNADIVKKIEKITGKKANIRKFTKLRDYDTNKWVCSNNTWGKTSLDKGLKRIYEEQRFEKKTVG